MTRNSHRADSTADLFWEAPASRDWQLPAVGHGVRFLQRQASPMRCVHCVRVAVAIVAASLVYLLA